VWLRRYRGSRSGADQRPEFAPSHPWGCHRRRIPDRVVFDHIIAALVHGSGYERLASPGQQVGQDGHVVHGENIDVGPSASAAPPATLSGAVGERP
jgi:hypothetical protein